jgi:hypothetical protein
MAVASGSAEEVVAWKSAAAESLLEVVEEALM